MLALTVAALKSRVAGFTADWALVLVLLARPWVSPRGDAGGELAEEEGRGQWSQGGMPKVVNVSYITAWNWEHKGDKHTRSMGHGHSVGALLLPGPQLWPEGRALQAKGGRSSQFKALISGY